MSIQPPPKRVAFCLSSAAFLFSILAVYNLPGQVLAKFLSPTNSLGFSTKGSAVFSLHYYALTNIMPSPWAQSPLPPTTLAPEIRERLLARRTQTVAQVSFVTNRTWVAYRPESLANLLWTNLLALTNGRSPAIWSERTHPLGWPLRGPSVKWNTRGLMWGLHGLTALSPCWEAEGNPGQTPITALTRRHGYTRGHSMGPEGFHQSFAGKRVWFVTTGDKLVQVKVTREVVRTSGGSDYTVLLFDKDLPEGIEPLRVCAWSDILPRVTFLDDVPSPVLMTEQGGNVNANLPGFKFEVTKGGDSGSPNLLALSGELVFYGGRTTSSPSPGLQADMDQLCRLEGLNPGRYQMQWVDLSAFPRY